MNESLQTAPIVRYAGFWSRFYAGFIDALVMIPILSFNMWAINTSWYLFQFIIIPIFLAGAWYNIYFHGRWGATLGKMAAKIKVVDVSGAGIGYRQAFYRHAVDLALAAASCICAIIAIHQMSPTIYETMSMQERFKYYEGNQPDIYGLLRFASNVWVWSELIALLCNEKKRAIHDFIAGTVVIHTQPLPQSPDKEGEANETLENHRLWVISNGMQGVRGVFSKTSLFRRDLRGVTLKDAIFHGTSFYGADLRGTDFTNTVLDHALLTGARMDERTNFTGADLLTAILDVRDFRHAKVDLTVTPREKLPLKLRFLWDEQQRNRGQAAPDGLPAK